MVMRSFAEVGAVGGTDTCTNANWGGHRFGSALVWGRVGLDVGLGWLHKATILHLFVCFCYIEFVNVVAFAMFACGLSESLFCSHPRLVLVMFRKSVCLGLTGSFLKLASTGSVVRSRDC